MAANQTVKLVLDMIRSAMKQEKKRATAELQPHSGRGGQYTSYICRQEIAAFQQAKGRSITLSVFITVDAFS